MEQNNDLNEQTANGESLIEIDIMAVLKLLWQKKIIIALVAFLSAAATLAYSYFLITPTYKASILISVSMDSNSAAISSSELSTAQKLVNTYIVILNTRTTMEQVKSKAGVDYSYEELSEMISASSVNSTEIFRVSVKSSDPYEAQRIANTIGKIMPERVAKLVNGSIVNIVDYAAVPEKRDSPSYSKNTMLGFLLGMIVAVGVITLREILDTHIKSKAYLTQNYSIPILATIPDMTTLNDETEE